MTTSDSTRAPSVRTACELRIRSSFRTELEIFNIQLERQQGDDNLRLANLHSCLPASVRTACELRISSLWRTELEIFTIQSEQQQQRSDELQSPLCPPFIRTANFLFMAYGTRDFQHSIRTATKRRQRYGWFPYSIWRYSTVLQCPRAYENTQINFEYRQITSIPSNTGYCE